MTELVYHIQNLKNNKKTYDYDDDDNDNFQFITFKKSASIIGDILLMVYNYWKKTADISNGMNSRCLVPIYKSGKSKETIKRYAQYHG